MFWYKSNNKPKIKDFVWRNHEILRIEAFSDAVFAFAVTLTIISLEVPLTFHELKESMWGMLGFGLCFAFLFSIWYKQYLYFRHFGLHDFRSIVLNAILIFVLLFYVYPLKFLASMLTTGDDVIVNGKVEHRFETQHDVASLMLIYSVGLVAIYVTLFLMYRHAWKQKEELKLSTIELFNLKTEMYQTFILLGIGMITITAVLTLDEYYSGTTGFIYMFIGPAFAVLMPMRRKIFHKVFSAEEIEKHNAAVKRSEKKQEHGNHLD